MAVVLVTGSSGFIGSHLCRALLERGDTVKAFHRATSRLQLLEDLSVEHVIGDLTRPETFLEIFQGVDYLFHTAAMLGGEKPGQMYTTNVEGTRSVLKAALLSGVKKVVYTSSMAALGIPELISSGKDNLPVLDENHSWNYSADFWPYGYAKYLAELEVQKFVSQGLDVVIVNPTLVYGPGDLYKQANSLVVQMARRKIPGTVDGGINVIHVTDVVNGHLAALDYGRMGERYILGGENLTYTALITQAAAAAGVPVPENVFPAGLLRALSGPASVFKAFISAPVPLNFLRLAGYYLYYDNRKACQQLNWAPTLSPQQALHDAFEWFKLQGVI